MNDNRKQQCARCGSCTVVCPVYRVTGREALAARGKLHLLSSDLANKPSAHFQDIFAQCLLCGACEDNCSRHLDIRSRIVSARATFSNLYGRHPVTRMLARKALSRPSLLEGLVKAGLSISRLDLLPADSGLRIKLGLLDTHPKSKSVRREPEREGIETDGNGFCYFSGCMARYLQPSIGIETVSLVSSVTGKRVMEPGAQVCCGLAAWSAGKEEEARKLARKNIEAFAGSSVQILTSCSSCTSHLKKYPSLFEHEPQWRQKAENFSKRVREFTAFLDENIQEEGLKSKSPARVYYHEPCHLRFAKENERSAQHLLEKVENISFVNHDKESLCCGQGGLFHLGYPELSGDIFSRVFEQVSQDEADVVVTTCSGCLMQWQTELMMRKSRIKAVHLAQWLESNIRKNG